MYTPMRSSVQGNLFIITHLFDLKHEKLHEYCECILEANLDLTTL